MNVSRPDTWPREAASALVVEAVEALCARHSIDSDPAQTRRAAQRVFNRTEWVDREAVAKAVEAGGTRAGLSFTRATVDAKQAFESAPVPLVLTTGQGREAPCLVLLDRARSKVLVMGHGWVNRAAFSRLVGDGDRMTALSATPQAPLSSLAQPANLHSMMARVGAFLRLERDDLAAVLVFAVAVGLLSLATPVAVQSVVSSVAFSGLVQPLAVLSLLLFAALGLAALLRALQARTVELLERRLFVRTAIDFAYRFPRLAPSVRQESFGPHVANRFFEVVTLQKTASALLIDGVAVALQAGTGLVLMAFYHPYLLAFGIALCLVVGSLMVLPWKKGLATAYDESAAKYAVAEWLEELSRVPQTFQGYAEARWASEQAETRVRVWLKARAAHFSVSFGQLSGALALHAIASTVLLAVGGALVMKSELTLGQLVAAELVVTAVMDALVKLGRLLDKGYDFTISTHKLGGVVDLPLEPSALGERLPVGGPSGKRVLARDVQVAGSAPLSFVAPPGARVALVEAHGTTRHRLAQVLAGHDAPDEGSLELDGVDTRRADLMEIRGRVALVRAQGIFEGSLFDNITVGRPSVGPEQVKAALARVGLFDAARALPDGLDTALSATGHPLSFDQQVQVLVARALAGHPRLLVVEDFFDALSPPARDACVRAVAESGEHTLVAVCSDASSELARRCVKEGAAR